MADPEVVTVELGGRHGDKVVTELRAIQRRFHCSMSEAIAVCVGYAVHGLTEEGLLGGRASAPMSRAQMLREMAAMIASAEEHDA